MKSTYFGITVTNQNYIYYESKNNVNECYDLVGSSPAEYAGPRFIFSSLYQLSHLRIFVIFFSVSGDTLGCEHFSGTCYPAIVCHIM
jgi:hypothetical protein